MSTITFQELADYAEDFVHVEEDVQKDEHEEMSRMTLAEVSDYGKTYKELMGTPAQIAETINVFMEQLRNRLENK